jgi:hypothetical protein
MYELILLAKRVRRFHRIDKAMAGLLFDVAILDLSLEPQNMGTTRKPRADFMHERALEHTLPGDTCTITSADFARLDRAGICKARQTYLWLA